MASYRFNVGVGWVVVDVDADTDAVSSVGWTAEEVELDMTNWISGRMVVIRGRRHQVQLEQMVSIIQQSRYRGCKVMVAGVHRIPTLAYLRVA